MRNESGPRAAVWATTICLLAAAFEATISGQNVASRFARLTTPSVSPPFWGWCVIGVAYYVVCFVVLYRLIGHGKPGGWRRVTLGLAVALMLTNAVWNWAFFGAHGRLLALVLLVPYNEMALALLLAAARVDRVAQLAFLPYSIFLIYADYWALAVWRLNS
ncbi:MAG: tryptophan-rich sensory protein [Gemmatimonadetes bacterium]|nr:tryptophan-rich sensory protein [Gemmatimonadota bacterium]